MVLFLRLINDFSYIPENESVGDILGWNKPMAALTAIITDSCLDIYYMVLHDPDLGYANLTPREFVVHFWNTYARYEDPDMSANLEQMMAQ